MASSWVLGMNINDDDDTEDEVHGSDEPSIETAGKHARGGRGRRGRGKRTSEVWKDFDLVYKYNVEKNLIEHEIYRKHKHSYSTTSSNGTNYMRRHIAKCLNKNMVIDLTQLILQ